ncbi:uncharacterized protein LOC115985626 [Quercus lobata]|uniref:uncharacterized protein LOC115985626 n=1 Tax=Quercus lobata TaxID=97700 RepID=UPI0012479182|nr:uncharacterized protein LOC115985626 [Quercus lobata]
MIPIISEIHIMGLLFNIKSKRKLALIYYITYSSLISVKTPAIGVENITSLTRKRVVVHVRHHADHEDDVLRHDRAGDVLCHHDEHVGDVLRHEHDEHVVDVLRHHNNALLLQEDHDHDRRDPHRHHDNALLFRHDHVHVLRDVLRHDHVHVLHEVPHRGVGYDDDFRGETFSNVFLNSKLRILEVSL